MIDYGFKLDAIVELSCCLQTLRAIVIASERIQEPSAEMATQPFGVNVPNTICADFQPLHRVGQ